MWMKLLSATILASVSCGACGAGGPVDYPRKPIRLIVGPPGSSSDFIARVVGPKLTERFGQPVIVDNRGAGAGGNIAAEVLSRANPDGYTLMIALNPQLASSPSLYKNLGFDLMKDFSYVSLVATGANVMLSHPGLAVNSVQELVAYAKARPGEIRYGSSGVASPHHLAAELLQSSTGIRLVHVPYKGSARSVVALIAGEVHLGFTGVPGAISMVTAKRLNALAITSAKRVDALPRVPTIAESGIPGFDVTSIFGALAPIGTPPAVITKLNMELGSILQTSEIKSRFLQQGLETTVSTPQEWKASMQRDVVRWRRVINEANITPD